MPVRARRLGGLVNGELALATGIAAAVFVFGVLATHKWGLAALAAPLAVVIVVLLVMRPVLLVTLAVALTILSERATFGLFTFTYSFYDSVVKDLTIPDVLVALAVISVLVDVIRTGRPLWIPRMLRLPSALLACAMIAGAVTGHAAGASWHRAFFSEDTLAYVLFLPLAVANLDLDAEQLRRLLLGAMALAVLKALLGLIEFASGRGLSPEGIGNLTYYEVAANWVVMMGLFVIVAALVMRVRAPLFWVVLCGIVLFASLLLSYRRSFWIAAVLGVALIVLLGLAPTGRRLLLPTILAMLVAGWLLSTINFQVQSPIVRRALSLRSSSVQASIDDRYRLAERANVWANIREHPVTGLGVTIPWQANAAPLPINTEGGREYVHFAALWWWLKLGVLGVLAYASVLLSAAALAWQTWRRNRDPVPRVFGLASLCAVAGLVVLDTTASFTGVDLRFSLIFGAQLGLLALASQGPGLNAASATESAPEHAQGLRNGGGSGRQG
jgi:O-antigen ligase